MSRQKERYMIKRTENKHDVTLWYKWENGCFKYNHLEYGLSPELKPIAKSESQKDWYNYRWINEWAYIYKGYVIYQGEFDFGLKELPDKDWHEIPDYPLYKININGEVRSWNKFNGRKMKVHTNNNGYKALTLCKDGVPYRTTIHRLLANVFLNNPFNFDSVNHKDGDTLNNNLSNLEWVPHKENMRHATRSRYE